MGNFKKENLWKFYLSGYLEKFLKTTFGLKSPINSTNMLSHDASMDTEMDTFWLDSNSAVHGHHVSI